jgi:hypothetical protein
MTGPVAEVDADACVHAEDWLSLAAAPTFAAMALATAVQDAAAPAVLCSAMPHLVRDEPVQNEPEVVKLAAAACRCRFRC